VRVSLGQIEQMARKAARGAGFAWGLADQVGQAVRWLHTYALNGAPALAAHLDDCTCDGAPDYAARAPARLAGVWRAPIGPLDPLATGASMSDCIDAMPGGIETAAIARPLLAAAFIGHAAHSEGLAFEVTWPGCVLSCARGRVRAGGPAVDAATAAFMRCRPCAPHGPAFGGRCRAARIVETAVNAGVWARLEHHARRTHVSATAASRLAGAGAGLHDND